MLTFFVIERPKVYLSFQWHSCFGKIVHTQLR